MMFHGKLVRYDGLAEVRIITSSGTRFSFTYSNCSQKDQQYLDSLDSPINVEAGSRARQMTVWYYPAGPETAGRKDVKWAQGEILEGRKEGLWTRWRPDQTLLSRGVYKADRKTGRWEYFDINGQVDYIEDYPVSAGVSVDIKEDSG